MLIDIHSHITFGLDDGARTLEESINMAKQAVAEGISTIIATPHHRHPSYDNPKEIIKKNVSMVNEKLQSLNIPLSVLTGQEIRLFGEIESVLDLDEELLTLNQSKMLLIELPSSNIPIYTEKLFYNLLVIGYKPVIAHPERNSEIVQNPEKLYQLIKNGAYSQVTAASVAGGFGRKTQRLSIQMIEYQLTHFIGSDAHNLTNRGFKWRDAWDIVDKKIGIDYAVNLKKQAIELIGNRDISKLQPELIPRKKFFIF
ncbi:MAG: CpsB/CapC family capsule biosynthesis tyrosine phosphatase [Melioribacteraceae bacterium]|nr:CpsB/CapC family capsule biosynthesis tyrosine phosphatase [Melioribacteraceae bacterium]